MRFIVHIVIPHDPFNDYVREGIAGERLQAVIRETRPEHIWLTDQDGQRGAVAIYDIAEASGVPSIAEPWFLTFEADCTFQIAMTPDDLASAGLEELGRRWG